MDTFTEYKTIISSLGTERTAGYLAFPLPNPIDVEILKIIDSYIGANDYSRNLLRQEFLRQRQGDALLAFSERMAILAVRENNPQRIFEGLIAHVIEDIRWDYRENLLILVLLYHSAVKIGVDPVALFEKAAGFATPKTVQFLHEYILKGEKDIMKMGGYSEVMRPDGFWYERNW